MECLIKSRLQLLRSYPHWQQPKTLLFVLSVAMALAFWVWSALLNNFVIEVGGFDGADIGWLYTIREMPGFLAVGGWRSGFSVVFSRTGVWADRVIRAWSSHRRYSLVPFNGGYFDCHIDQLNRVSLL